MIIEHLISKYLDADLTPEENSELRRITTSDPVMKECFEDAVLSNIAIRFNTDTAEVSEDVRKSVFDAIDSRIESGNMTAYLFGGISSKTDKKSSAQLTVSLLVTVSLFLMCIPISDSFNSVNAPLATNTLKSYGGFDGDASTSSSTMKNSAKGLSKGSDAINSQNGSEQLGKGIELPAFDNASATLQESLVETTNGESSSTALPSLSAQFWGLVNLPDATKFVDVPNSISQNQSPAVRDEMSAIRLTTSYSRGLTGSGSAIDVVNISQSIGYSFSEDGFLGLEVGSSSYTVARVTSTRSGEPSTVAQTRVVSDKSKLSVITEPPPSYTLSSSTFVATEQSVWGAAFVEKSLLTLGSVSFNGRAAIGAGEDGVISYGRFSAAVFLLPSVSFTIGAEANLMPYRVGPDAPGKSGLSQYGVGVNALTGVHIQF